MIMLYRVSDNMCTDMTLAQCADEKKKIIINLFITVRRSKRRWMPAK